ncbi:MAG: hypothetical protein II781_00780, partial [Clostridia bacterium]|nr:hypothetical protein [Clostridia bacterium]
YPGTRTMQSTERFLLHASFERMEGSIPRLYSSGMEVMVQAGTACIPGFLEYTVKDHGDFPIQSGEDTDVYIKLTRPLLLKPGDPVLLYEDWFLVASGLVASVR